MTRLAAALILTFRFLRAVVVSGWQTVGVILRNAEAPPAAFVRMRFAPMSETGAALLGCMISLTPGTTTLDVDMGRREMLLHLLDASDPDAVVAGIRADFERYLVVLYGTREHG
jgi:multisubunit Na+/H+ antiporter MnhE subunit